MAFVTNPKYRGRVRTTRRIVSEPNRLGHRTLLAREGETMSISEAFRRGIPEDALAPVGPAGEAAFAVLKGRGEGEVDGELVAAAEAAGDDADRPERSTDESRTRGLLRPAADGGEFPRRKGGPYWELSDGSTFRGSADEAAAAEAALADVDDDQDDEAADDGEPVDEAGDDGDA